MIIDAGDARFDGMKISKVGEPFFCLGNKVGESWFRVFHPHSLPSVPGGDAESNSVLANGLRDRFDDFKRKPGPVLNRPTIFVRSLVRDVLEELIWKVSIGEVKLDPVESGLVDGPVGCVGMPLDVGLDFVDRHRTGSRVGWRNGDGRWADNFRVGVLGLEQFDVCGATVSPELDKDVRAVGVDGVYDLGSGNFRQWTCSRSE